MQPIRLYTVVFQAVAVTAQQDLFEITPGSNRPCVLMGLFVQQSSEVGDAQEEMLRWSIMKGHATSGSGGTTPTPVPRSATDPAAGFTAEVNNTTLATGGSPVTNHVGTFNVRVGLEMWWPQDTAIPVTSGTTRMVVRLLNTPADEITMSGTAYVGELV